MLLETKNVPDPNGYKTFLSSGEKLYMRHYFSKDSCDFYELDFGEMKWVSHEKTRKEYYTFFFLYPSLYGKNVFSNESRGLALV